MGEVWRATKGDSFMAKMRGPALPAESSRFCFFGRDVRARDCQKVSIPPLLEQCDLRCQGAAFIRATLGVQVLMVEVRCHYTGGLIGKITPLPRHHDTLDVAARCVHEYGEVAIDGELRKRGDFLDGSASGIPAIVPGQQITHEIARVLKHDHLIGPDLREEMNALGMSPCQPSPG